MGWHFKCAYASNHTHKIRALHPAHPVFGLLSFRHHPRPWTVPSPTAWGLHIWVQVETPTGLETRPTWLKSVLKPERRKRETWSKEKTLQHFQEILAINLGITPPIYLWQLKSKVCQWVRDIWGKGRLGLAVTPWDYFLLLYLTHKLLSPSGPEASP